MPRPREREACVAASPPVPYSVVAGKVQYLLAAGGNCFLSVAPHSVGTGDKWRESATGVPH